MNSGEDSAFLISSSSSSATNEYDGSVSMSTDSFWKTSSVVSEIVEVVKDVGLITCGRSEFCQRARTPQLAETQGMFALALSTWKKRFRTEYRWKWEEKEVGDRERPGDKATTQRGTINRSPRMAWRWNDARMQTLEPCSVIAHNQTRAMCMRKMTCEMYLSKLAIHSVSLSSDPHMMSLNIDMNIIRPRNCSSSPIFVHELLDFLDELQCSKS